MKFQVRQRDRRALAGLVAAAGIYMLLSMAVFPAVDRLKDAARSTTEKEEQLRKYRQAMQRKGHYAQLLEQARKSVTEAESRLIRGDNASQASIELQGFVEESAKKMSIEFEQRNISPAKKKDDYFNEITISMSFGCTPNQLTAFLTDLRNSPKFITVRSMQISPVSMETALPKKGELRKIIRVNLTVGAILLNPEKKG